MLRTLFPTTVGLPCDLVELTGHEFAIPTDLLRLGVYPRELNFFWLYSAPWRDIPLPQAISIFLRDSGTLSDDDLRSGVRFLPVICDVLPKS